MYEALKICGSMIETLEKIGARPGDHKYVRLFEDYREAVARGEKVSYVVACLAARYSMSERGVYDVLKRLGNDCKSASP